MIQLYYPLIDVYITSYFGKRWGSIHNGLDFRAAEGTDVLASADGTVIWVGYSGKLGKWNEENNNWDVKPAGFGIVFLLHTKMEL